MNEKLVNLHAGLCTLWVDHPHLEPEIPRNSLVIISQKDRFENDGIYAVQGESDLALLRCSGGHFIALSDNKSQSKMSHESADFSKLVIGKVIAHVKLWDISNR